MTKFKIKRVSKLICTLYCVTEVFLFVRRKYIQRKTVTSLRNSAKTLNTGSVRLHSCIPKENGKPFFCSFMFFEINEKQ